MFRTLTRGAAAVGLVGLTSLGVVVSAGPAQAFDISQMESIVAPVAGIAARAGAVAGVEAGASAAAGTGAGLVCATGVGCVVLGIGVLAIGVGATAYATKDSWWPWLRSQFQDDPADHFVTSDSVKYYPDPVGGFDCMTATAVDPGSWGSTGHVKFDIYVNNVESNVCFAPVNYAVDCLGTDGVLRHSNLAVTGGSNWPYQSTQHIDVTPCNDGHGSGSANGFSALRALHFQADQASMSTTWNHRQVRGFRWGDVGLPGTGTIDATINCKRPDGTTYSVIGSEDINSGAVKMPHCNAGDTPQSVDIGATDTTTGAKYPQSHYDLAQQALDDATPYPDCASGQCTWVVKIDGLPCQPGTYPCATWTQTYVTTPSRVQCWYGPYQLTVEHCYWMERAYETGGAPATVPNTDGDPGTYTPPGPAPEPSPSSTSSSSTTAQPTVTDSPTSSSSTSSSSSPSPSDTSSPTASSSTGPTPGQAGQPATDDTAGRDCWPNGWGIFNPSEWVLKPMRCAFEPSPQATATRAAEVQSKLDAVGVGPVWDAVGANFSALGSGGGCAGPTVHFGLQGVSEDIQPFNACDPPISTAAFYTKSLASVVLIVGGGLAVARAIAAGFGFSFHMGKGGDGDN